MSTRRREYDAYQRTFQTEANARRLELIDKMFSGFTEEEGQRRMDVDPAWKEEFERRIAANLTDQEHAEYAELNRILDEWSEKSPWQTDLREQMERDNKAFEELMAKVRRKIEEKGGGSTAG